MDLLDVFRGTLSVRRAWSLIEHLPRDSALHRAADPDGEAWWPRGEHLLALVVDALRMQLWQHSSGAANIPRPSPIPRPGVVDEVAERRKQRDEWFKAYEERQKALLLQEGPV